MKFDLKLLSLFVGDAALDVTHVADSDLAPRQCHPRCPSVVAWAVPRMVRVAVAGSHLNTSPRKSLHRSEANMRFLASVLPQMLWHQPDQRTRCTAVRLLWRQLNLYDISLRHFYFCLSGNLFSMMLSPVFGVALFHVSKA
jgi:hypothetical protein